MERSKQNPKKTGKIFLTILICFLLVGTAMFAVGRFSVKMSNTVKVNAMAKIYTSHVGGSPVGVFLDIFDEVKRPGENLGKLIDQNRFPYEITVQAISTPPTAEKGQNPTRYLIVTNEGDHYWIEPWFFLSPPYKKLPCANAHGRPIAVTQWVLFLFAIS